MGILSRLKGTLTQKANAAIDRATDPAKEIDLAIAELEEQRKKALAELISYKANAKQMDNDLERHRKKALEWEARAMSAIKAGDDELAKQALREKKASEAEIEKISRDRNEAAGYAAQLNKSRKEFETKLQMFKLRKGTLATQLAAARSPGGDAFGNDPSVWDRFASAEDKIDRTAIESEVDSAMRGEEQDAHDFDLKLAAATKASGGEAAALPAGDDPLAQLKRKMEEQKAQKAQTAKALAAGADAPAGGEGKGS